MLSDDFGAELREEIKVFFYNYYSTIKNNIDIISQTALIDQDNPNLQKEIQAQNNILIDDVDDTITSNMNEIDNFFHANYERLNQVEFYSRCNYNEEDLKRLVIGKFCFYMPPEELKAYQKQENRLGCLITSDWYMTNNEKGFIIRNMKESYSGSAADLEINEVN